jgi:hypothetical protein
VRGSGFDFVVCGFYAKSEAEENLQAVAVCELNTIAVKGGKKKGGRGGGGWWVGRWRHCWVNGRKPSCIKAKVFS